MLFFKIKEKIERERWWYRVTSLFYLPKDIIISFSELYICIYYVLCIYICIYKIQCVNVSRRRSLSKKRDEVVRGCLQISRNVVAGQDDLSYHLSLCANRIMGKLISSLV